MAAQRSVRLVPPPFRSGGEGEDKDCVVAVKQAGAEGMAKLVDGFVAPDCAGKGAINPSWLPPMLRCGWEGAGRAGNGGRAELGDGHAALW